MTWYSNQSSRRSFGVADQAVNLLRGKCADLCVADDDPQCPSAGRLRDLVELADHERPAAVGLADLDLDAVAGTNGVGRAGAGVVPYLPL